MFKYFCWLFSQSEDVSSLQTFKLREKAKTFEVKWIFSVLMRFSFLTDFFLYYPVMLLREVSLYYIGAHWRAIRTIISYIAIQNNVERFSFTFVYGKWKLPQKNHQFSEFMLSLSLSIKKISIVVKDIFYTSQV